MPLIDNRRSHAADERTSWMGDGKASSAIGLLEIPQGRRIRGWGQ